MADRAEFKREQRDCAKIVEQTSRQGQRGPIIVYYNVTAVNVTELISSNGGLQMDEVWSNSACACAHR